MPRAERGPVSTCVAFLWRWSWRGGSLTDNQRLLPRVYDATRVIPWQQRCNRFRPPARIWRRSKGRGIMGAWQPSLAHRALAKLIRPPPPLTHDRSPVPTGRHGTSARERLPPPPSVGRSPPSPGPDAIHSSRTWSQSCRASALRRARRCLLFQTSTPADRSNRVRAARIASASDPHATENPAAMWSEGSSW